MSEIEKVRAYRKAATPDEWEHDVHEAESYARRDHPAPSGLVALGHLRVLDVELDELRELWCPDDSVHDELLAACDFVDATDAPRDSYGAAARFLATAVRRFLGVEK